MHQVLVLTGGGTDQFIGIDLGLLYNIGFTMLNIVALVFIMYKLLHGPVTRFLKKRADNIETQINDAAAILKEADILKGEYGDKLKDIDAERENILETVKKRALTNEAQVIKKANEQAEQVKQRAYDDIEREKDKAQAEMKRQILVLSTMLTERYLSDSLNTEHQNRLLDDIIEEMRGAKWQS